MERGSFQGIALGLERIVETTLIDLREAIDQFQGLCLMITAERSVPIDIINDTRQAYKKIQDHSPRSAQQSNFSKENTGSIIAVTISAKEKLRELRF